MNMDHDSINQYEHHPRSSEYEVGAGVGVSKQVAMKIEKGKDTPFYSTASPGRVTRTLP